MALSITINKVAVADSFAAGTKVADIVVSGGTSPYSYSLASGGDYFQIEETEVRVIAEMNIDNIQSFSVFAEDSTSGEHISGVSEEVYPNITAKIQSRFNSAGKIYKITQDIDLGHGVLTIPSGCTLDFQGGSFSNGTLSISNTKFIGENGIRTDTIMSGWTDYEVETKVFVADSTDMSKVINNILEVTNSIFINKGIYNIIGTIVISGTKTINGEQFYTIFKKTGNEPCVTVAGNYNTIKNIRFEDSQSNNECTCILAKSGTQYNLFENLFIKGFNEGINLASSCWSFNIINDIITHCNYGITAYEGAYEVNNIHISFCSFNYNGTAIYVPHGLSYNIDNCWIELNDIGVYKINRGDCHISKCYIENNKDRDIMAEYGLSMPDFLSVEDCYFYINNRNTSSQSDKNSIFSNAARTSVRNNYVNTSYSSSDISFFFVYARRMLSFMNNKVADAFIEAGRVAYSPGFNCGDGLFQNGIIGNPIHTSITNGTLNLSTFINATEIIITSITPDESGNITIILPSYNDFETFNSISRGYRFRLLFANVNFTGTISFSKPDSNMSWIGSNYINRSNIEFGSYIDIIIFYNQCRIINHSVNQNLGGSTSGRPTNCPIGKLFFDTTINKEIVYNGTAWVNMDGTALE